MDHGGVGPIGFGPGLVGVRLVAGWIQRNVRDGVGQVEEKRMVFMLANIIECFSGEEIVRVGLAIERNFLMVAPKEVWVIVVRGNVGLITEEVIEADGLGIAGGIGAAHTPFADSRGVITRLFEDFAKRGEVIRERRIALGGTIPSA